MQTAILPAGGIADLWDTRQAAGFLGVAPRTLDNWRSLYTSDDPRCLPYLKFGRHVYYDPNTVKAWIAKRLTPRRATQAGD